MEDRLKAVENFGLDPASHTKFAGNVSITGRNSSSGIYGGTADRIVGQLGRHQEKLQSQTNRGPTELHTGSIPAPPHQL